ncbi:hypothetical protein [Bacillus sp. UNC437CL72CviS29]|uniref:hypothetical protein n=1 Tax=Bacillus sp. UNC437CL72CviS29 TaxID=1340430 RepID=UPI000B189BD7|nr:hypothetical protein [Bacillus sp. UNC437CL72CviS29]
MKRHRLKKEWETYIEDYKNSGLSRRQLRWLLDGFSFQQKQGHQAVHARCIL